MSSVCETIVMYFRKKTFRNRIHNFFFTTKCIEGDGITHNLNFFSSSLFVYFRSCIFEFPLFAFECPIRTTNIELHIMAFYRKIDFIKKVQVILYRNFNVARCFVSFSRGTWHMWCSTRKIIFSKWLGSNLGRIRNFFYLEIWK